MAMNEPVRPLLSADADPSAATAGDGWRIREFLKEHGIATLIGLATVIIITTIMIYVGDYFVRDHLIFFYLFPITGIAMYFSSTPALVTSLGSGIAAAYLFPPAYSWRINEPLQIAELFIFCMLALIASKASSRLLR
jgi:K+-sensing histidine kinase KdpD